MADHMITTYREKAEKWVQQAEKAQRRVYMGPMSRFKFQDASNYLELAGQCFRVAKRFQDAGVAYKQCGRLEDKLNNPEVAASFYHEAALCFQKDDPQEAAACYLSAINLFCQRQLFSTAARLECEVAELMENDRNRRLAIVHHIKAADFYRANTCFEEATDRCLLKAAHALALSESYVEAASLFQEVGRRMLVDDLLGFNTPDTFLKAVLCLQCASGMPEVRAQCGNCQRLRPVPEVHQGNRGPEAPSPRPTLISVKATIVALGKASSFFQGSMAYIFATDVVLAEKEGDVDFFAARLYAYNNVCRLSAWYLRMLKTIGDHIQVKAVQLRKMRALQEKLRRRQRAEERAKDRIKRRQQDLSIQDDSSEGTASQANDFASSSEDTLPTNTDTKPTQSSSHSSSESGGSDSDSDSDSDDDGSSSGTDSSSSSVSGSDDSGASSGTSGSSPSDSSSSLESGSSGSSETSKENATDGTPAKKSSAKTKAVGGAGGASPTVSDSDSSATRSEANSENSNSTIVNAPNTKKTKKKGSVRFAKSNPSASDSGASNAASGSAESSGDSEGGSSSGSSEDSKGAKKKAGKEASGGNLPGKQSKSKGGKKAKSTLWKKR